MSEFYSEKLKQGISLLYFRNAPEQYSGGVQAIEQAAYEGEPDAYYFLACDLIRGEKDEAKEEKKAAELFKTGIGLGSDLCVLGAKRSGVLEGEIKDAMRRPLADSFEAVKERAQDEDAIAQYEIGLFYYGQDVSVLQKPKTQEEAYHNELKNAEEGLRWLRLAAHNGCVLAYEKVYHCLSKGENGILRDRDAAVAFAEEVWELVEISGEGCYNVSYDYGELKNYEQQRLWAERGAKKGDAACFNSLGLLYLNGYGTKEDDEKAYRNFCEADARGNKFGSYNLGRCCYRGWGVPKDPDQAFGYFLKSAKQDHAGAMEYVAHYYFEGTSSVSQDFLKCREWSEKALSQGKISAKYYLGYCYLNGVGGCEKNYPLAHRYFADCSATRNHNQGNAYRALGSIHEKALGVPVNLNKAVYYYEKASHHGCEQAKEDLTRFKKNLFGNWKRTGNRKED